MKYIKTYENKIFNESLIDNYIIININDTYWPTMYKDKRTFINNNIGKIVEVNLYDTDSLHIKYYNIPNELRKMYFPEDGIFVLHSGHSVNIVDISKNIEDLEYIYDMKKYNL